VPVDPIRDLKKPKSRPARRCSFGRGAEVASRHVAIRAQGERGSRITSGISRLVRS
jgi:hypothetical protein